MTRNFSAQTTARQVVRATVPDLVAFFGQRPRLVGVFQDQRDRKSACVFFSESLGGQPVKGISVIKVTDYATREWVVFCQANAPRGEAMKSPALHKPSQPAVETSALSTGPNAAAARLMPVRSRQIPQQIPRPMTPARPRLLPRVLPAAQPAVDSRLPTLNSRRTISPTAPEASASPMAGPAHHRRSATASSKARPTKRLVWIQRHCGCAKRAVASAVADGARGSLQAAHRPIQP